MSNKVYSPQDIFRIAKSHPWYQQKLSALSRFEEVPLTTKDFLAPHLIEIAENPLETGIYWSPTGGTSLGKSLYFPTDLAENTRQREIIAELFKQYGAIDQNTRALILFGSTGMTRATDIFTHLCEINSATALPAGSLTDDQDVEKLVSHFKPNLILGSPKRLLQFAHHCLSSKHPLSIEKVMFGGEPISNFQKETIKKLYDAKEVLGAFGAAESGMWGLSTSDFGVSTYLVPRLIFHLEISEPDPSGLGELVATNLIRTRFPLLRFRTGDKCRLSVTEDHYRLTYSHRVSEEIQIGSVVLAAPEISELCGSVLIWQMVVRELSSNSDLELRIIVSTDNDSPSLEILEDQLQRFVEAKGLAVLPAIQLVPLAELLNSPGPGKYQRTLDLRPKS